VSYNSLVNIIIGLGNPGVEYVNTRHNAGIFLVDRLASLPVDQSDYGWRKFYGIMTCKFPDFILAKTADYFMNESGNVIYDIFRLDEFKNITPSRPPLKEISPSVSIGGGQLYVVHDDLDIKLGEYKIQKGVGPKLHNGVEAVEKALGTKDFWRIRIGVDNRIPNTEYRIPGEEYVLQKFSGEERKALDEVLEKITDEITKTTH